MTTKFIVRICYSRWYGTGDLIHQSIHSTLQSAKDWANSFTNAQSYVEVNDSYFCYIGDYEVIISKEQVEEYA